MSSTGSDNDTQYRQSPTSLGRRPRSAPPTTIIAVVYLAIACALFLPYLWAAGLSMTEGHRAIPAWNMLDPDIGPGYIVLYETSYARKPPGTQWFFAASAAILGQTPFSARLVSAIAITIAGLAAWWFGAGWFSTRTPVGDRQINNSSAHRSAALIAVCIPATGAFAAILTPMLWPVARSAEIEALLVMGAALAAFGMLDAGLTVTEDRADPESAPKRLRRVVGAIATTLGVFVVIVTKGPAGVPVLVAAFAAPAVVTRSFRPIGAPRVWAPALIGAVIAGWSLRDYVFQYNAPNTITEDLTGFLFRPDRFYWVLLLPAAAFVAAMPASLGLLFSWGKDARTEAEASAESARARSAAHACALAWIIAAMIYAATGLSNPRYVMPAVVFLWPMWSYIARGVLVPGVFTDKRATIARVFMLGRPVHLVIALSIAGLVFSVVYEQRRQRISGRAAGDALLASLLADNAAGENLPLDRIALLADGVVEARPEILLPISQAGVRVLWHKPELRTYGAGLPRQALYLALRQDDGSDELTGFDPAAWLPESIRSYSYRIEKIAEHRTHKFNTVLVRLHRGERRR